MKRYGLVRVSSVAGALAVLALAAIGACACRARADALGDMLRAADAKTAPAVVTIRVVNNIVRNIDGQTHQVEATFTFHGIVVDPDGLILTTDGYVSADRFKQYAAMAGQTDNSVQFTPEEIRITFGDEDHEYYGTVAVTDPVRGLAFIQIRDLKGRVAPYLDLAASASSSEPQIGEPTASVTRLSKDFDFAPLVIDDRIGAIIEKPRHAFVPEGTAGSVGLPVFGDDGSVIGILATMPPLAVTQAQIESDTVAQSIGDLASADRSDLIVPVGQVVPLLAIAKKDAAALPPFVIPAPRSAPAAPAAPAASSAKPT